MAEERACVKHLLRRDACGRPAQVQTQRLSSLVSTSPLGGS